MGGAMGGVQEVCSDSMAGRLVCQVGGGTLIWSFSFLSLTSIYAPFMYEWVCMCVCLKVASGLDHSLVLTTDHLVWGCGWSADGQTGNTDDDNNDYDENYGCGFEGVARTVVVRC